MIKNKSLHLFLLYTIKVILRFDILDDLRHYSCFPLFYNKHVRISFVSLTGSNVVGLLAGEEIRWPWDLIFSPKYLLLEENISFACPPSANIVSNVTSSSSSYLPPLPCRAMVELYLSLIKTFEKIFITFTHT